MLRYGPAYRDDVSHGDTLLDEETPTVNAKDILHKLNASCFDKLMLADEVVQGDIKLEEGQKDVKLSLLRVDMGVLSGLNEVQ